MDGVLDRELNGGRDGGHGGTLDVALDGRLDGGLSRLDGELLVVYLMVGLKANLMVL